MTATAVDTSVVVAALQSWHLHHEVARASLEQALVSGDEILLPTRVLLESFSVMTRLPAPHRLAPGDALALLEGTFKDSARVVDLPAGESWNLVRDCAKRQITGGTVYDADIIECALQAGATDILTLNRGHFERLAPEGLRVVVPSTP